MKNILCRTGRGYAALALCLAGGYSWGVEYHVTTAQEFQTALTFAAESSADDIIYLTNGYYRGSFNYSSTKSSRLTLQAEPGVVNDQVLIDAAGTGRSMNITCSSNTPITILGLTFLRDCGNASLAALRVAPGPGSDILVEDRRFISPTNTSPKTSVLDSLKCRKSQFPIFFWF